MKYKDISEEQKRDWRRQYEAGASVDDLVAIGCANGNITNGGHVRKAIVEVGGTIRSARASMLLLVAKRQGLDK